ncbi:hypothetical protein D6745_04175 [Candidatus Woesearchaeota archaeon]|nr:MAG: hypothetical protein D6745_04175 [Candidatus Woesearchaeota archaeon]
MRVLIIIIVLLFRKASWIWVMVGLLIGLIMVRELGMFLRLTAALLLSRVLVLALLLLVML